MLPELLAPVGGREQLDAAVNNGADAVYMGGSLFNARINAENFTDEYLSEAIDYAHERGVKVYITFNTLIRDSELERAFRYACRLYEMGADAIIVQDMGLARLVRKYLPDLPLHLSTQGTVYNEEALDLVRRLGFSRVVPARELSLEELSRFCRRAHDEGTEAESLEVEVFVHGALCMCYSGQCQMSRAFGGGGRSGNRGLCAQPCRLLYTDDKGIKGYFLSPKDLCTLELMPRLIEAGADSFKIEGRLKSPEYVAVVTSVYRKYLDLYGQFQSENRRISPEEWRELIDLRDMNRLKQIFNRGGFTTGYLEGNPGEKILSGQSPKNQGVYIGKVTGTSQIRRSSRGKVLVDVAPEGKTSGGAQPVAAGDGVEIRRKIRGSSAAQVTGSNVVTFVQRLSDGDFQIGDFDAGIEKGDRVYKVTDKELREEALSAPEKKIPVCMSFNGRIGEKPELTVELKQSGKTVSVVGDFALEKALKKPTSPEKVIAGLMKLGNSPFFAEADDIELELDSDVMIPVSAVNHMRRDGADILAEELRGALKAKRKPKTEKEIEDIITAEDLGNDDEVKRVESLGSSIQPDEMPWILSVSKGQLDEHIHEHFNEIASEAGETGILTGNLGWVKQFLDAGVTVYGDHGLNAYNNQSIKAYEELGIRMAYLSYETGRTDERFGGRIPLMITEHPFRTEYLTDRKGVKHEIIRMGDKSLIF